MEIIHVSNGTGKPLETTRLYWETVGIHDMPEYKIVQLKSSPDVRMPDKAQAKTSEPVVAAEAKKEISKPKK